MVKRYVAFETSWKSFCQRANPEISNRLTNKELDKGF